MPSTRTASTPGRAKRSRRPAWPALAWALIAAAGWGPWMPPAWAASSASWASSEGVSASVGSLSASVQSVGESSKGTARVAQGTYRVVELVPEPGRADLVAMRLERVAGQEPAADAQSGLKLVLPAVAVRATSVATGDRVHVRELPNGFEFAHGEPVRAFFLALREEGLGDLRTRALAL